MVWIFRGTLNLFVAFKGYLHALIVNVQSGFDYLLLLNQRWSSCKGSLEKGRERGRICRMLTSSWTTVHHLPFPTPYPITCAWFLRCVQCIPLIGSPSDQYRYPCDLEALSHFSTLATLGILNQCLWASKSHRHLQNSVWLLFRHSYAIATKSFPVKSHTLNRRL